MINKAIKSRIKKELASITKKHKATEAMAMAVKKKESDSDLSLYEFNITELVKNQGSQDSDNSNSFMSLTSDFV